MTLRLVRDTGWVPVFVLEADGLLRTTRDVRRTVQCRKIRAEGERTATANTANNPVLENHDFLWTLRSHRNDMHLPHR